MHPVTRKSKKGKTISENKWEHGTPMFLQRHWPSSFASLPLNYNG